MIVFVVDEARILHLGSEMNVRDVRACAASVMARLNA